MRVFISLKLSDEAIFEIKKIQKELASSGLFFGKLTEAENLHLTLKFLGDIDEEKVQEVIKRLRSVKISKFNLRLGSVGVFREHVLRIIWVCLLGAEELQRKIDMALEGLFKKEERFMSHLTIARIKKVSDKKKLFNSLEKIKIKEVEFEATTFDLMESELFQHGPRYRIIEEFSLA